MFYPEDSLKRGGRFYLCWLADSWPQHFDAIPQRQLWSQDVRKICVDLSEVITNESGRPANRFSLRLSSQLLHGLVRVYERKLNFLLGDLHMINANVFKHANKKYSAHDEEAIAEVRRPRRPLPPLEMQPIPEIPEDVRQLEEMIKKSTNVVTNIEDITLKESVIPEIQLPNDGFGEENPEQALQLLQDRTLEMMLLQSDASAVQHSGLDIALDVTDKSHDKSRLAPHDSAQMETIEEQDISLFKKSTGAELGAEFEKDIPEIPDIIPPSELSVPPADKVQEAIASPERVQVAPAPPMEIELEELESQPQAKRRRLKNKLIIDKKTKLTGNFIRSRIENPFVELRCEDSYDDNIVVRVPSDVYFRRPCHAGNKFHSNIGFEISRLFQRNLGPVHLTPLAERVSETALHRTRRGLSRLTLERIDEEPLPVQERPQLQAIEVDQQLEVDVSKQLEVDVSKQLEVDVSKELEVDKSKQYPLEPRVVIVPMDISDMPTHIIERQERKRLAAEDVVISPKRQRFGYKSFKETQQQAKGKDIQEGIPIIIETDVDKENVPDNVQPSPKLMERPSDNAERIISAMLLESGLADMPGQPETEQVPSSRARPSKRKTRSDSSETQLGSLDRTRVSLGDSDQTTDSLKFVRDNWGTKGTMAKIFNVIKAGRRPVTVRSLVSTGPALPGHERLIAAKCFISILKLKQHGFINIYKDFDKSEIRDITLGPKLTNSRES